MKVASKLVAISLVVLFTLLYTCLHASPTPLENQVFDANHYLQEALQQNDVEVAEALINAGSQVNGFYTIASESTTLLLYSLLHGKKEMTEMLLRNGADPDLSANSQVVALTPLMAALRKNDIADIELLCAFGVKIDRESFFFAARTGQTEIVRLFLSHNRNLVNYPDPLMTALQLHYIETAKVFIVEYGADINQRFSSPQLIDNNVHALHLLIDPLYLDTAAESINYILDISGRHGVAKIDVDAQDHNGRTPLYYATCFSGTLDIVKILVEKGGANLDLSDNRGKTPLMNAVSNGFTETATFLLDNGANPILMTRWRSNSG